MSQIHRTQIHHSILSVALILFCISVAIFSILRQSYFFGSVATVFAILLFYVELQRRKVKIELTEDSIVAELEKDKFCISWHTILMAHRVKLNDAIDFVELATMDDVFRIDLRLFNGNQVLTTRHEIFK